MSITLSPNAGLFSITLYYVEEIKENLSTFHIIDSLKDKQKWGNKVSTVITYWKSLTWKEHNIILRKANRNDKLDILIYRDTKLKMALKRIKDGDELINVTDEIIDNLDIKIAGALLTAYEKYSDPSVKELEEIRDAAHAYFTGKTFDPKFVPYFHEHQIAKHYGGNLDVIRAMDYRDFQAHLQICISRDRADNEFAAALAGAKSGAGAPSSVKKFDPNVGTFV